MNYVADFETTTTEPVRVWAWSITEMYTDKVEYGTTLDSFFQYVTNLSKKNNINIYFHNLKFDGEFILSWLFNHNYTHVTGKVGGEKEFSTLITDMGAFFSIQMCYKTKGKNKLKVTFRDSLKLLPMSVDGIAKAFDLDFQKLEIDYKTYRDEYHVLTKEEIEYIKNDVLIVSKGLEKMFEQDLTKITIASNALQNFKDSIDIPFLTLFPKLDLSIDSYIRKSYKGGFTYLNPKYKNKIIGEGLVLDVNSLYPSVMYDRDLPIMEPKFFIGKYQEDKDYPLYVCRIKCQFEIKEGHIPTIQLKGNFRYNATEYITSSEDNFEELTLTNVDLQLFFDHYNVYNLTYIDGFKFRSENTIFRNYINYWNKVKADSKDVNPPMYAIAKLMLNSLYGKFGMNPKARQKTPYYDDEIVHYEIAEEEERDPIYVAMASFITSYAREKTIRTAQLLKERYVYSDTDSIHLEGKDLPKNIDIHDTKLGFWSVDGVFDKAKYLRAKTYMYNEIKKGIKVTVAGLPASVTKYVTFDNFKPGTVFEVKMLNDEYKFNTENEEIVYIPVEDSKLRPKRVKGGIILEETKFTLKA